MIEYFLFDPSKETLSSTTTPRQSGTGSNDNEGILHISQNIQTGASPYGLESYLGH